MARRARDRLQAKGVYEPKEETMNSDTRIEQMLEAIGRASAQDFSFRLAISNVPDALQALESAVSTLVLELAETKERNRAQIREIELKNHEIAERQSMVLRELSTPIIAIWDGILSLPVIGTVDTARSAEMMDKLLERVVQDQATHVIIDITGVAMLDTRTADHFLRMGKAVRLLGAECFLTGISPHIAQTLAQLGVDTSAIRTVRRQSDALKIAFDELKAGSAATRTPV
jgi:rsbT co-antagonist protein RsbR